MSSYLCLFSEHSPSSGSRTERLKVWPLYPYPSFLKTSAAYQTELLPTIRNYVKLRQAIDTDGQQPEQPNCPGNSRPDEDSESLGRLSEQTSHKTEDIDIPMPDANNTPRSRSNSIPNDRDSTVQTGSASECTPSRSVEAVRPPQSTRSQAREADATVPKSVPFPPKAKPKTSRELLTRISYLTGELLRSSEEKVGLATAANNIVCHPFAFPIND